jgi:hypothetical protein
MLLGIMAAALVVMAAVQVGLIVVALKVARRLTTAVDDLRVELQPLIVKAHRIADDASRTVSLAALQAERVDQFLATTAVRVDETLQMLKRAVAAPTRQGAAVAAAIKTAVSVFRYWQDARRRPVREEEDALFVG